MPTNLMKDPATLAMQERFLRDVDLAERYGVHRNSVHRWSKLGKIPPSVKIGGSLRWRLSDIVAMEQEAAK